MTPQQILVQERGGRCAVKIHIGGQRMRSYKGLTGTNNFERARARLSALKRRDKPVQSEARAGIRPRWGSPQSAPTNKRARVR